MFVWDFATIIALGIILALGLVLTLWIRYNLDRCGRISEAEPVSGYFQQCRFCSYVYLDYARKTPCRCPRCLSYGDKGTYEN